MEDALSEQDFPSLGKADQSRRTYTELWPSQQPKALTWRQCCWIFLKTQRRSACLPGGPGRARRAGMGRGGGSAVVGGEIPQESKQADMTVYLLEDS